MVGAAFAKWKEVSTTVSARTQCIGTLLRVWQQASMRAALRAWYRHTNGIQLQQSEYVIAETRFGAAVRF